MERGLIRPMPAEQTAPVDEADVSSAELEKAREENRTLRKQMAQMIALSQEVVVSREKG